MMLPIRLLSTIYWQKNLIDLNEFNFWGRKRGVERGINQVSVLFKIDLGMVTQRHINVCLYMFNLT